MKIINKIINARFFIYLVCFLVLSLLHVQKASAAYIPGSGETIFEVPYKYVTPCQIIVEARTDLMSMDDELSETLKTSGEVFNVDIENVGEDVFGEVMGAAIKRSHIRMMLNMVQKQAMTFSCLSDRSTGIMTKS